MSENDHITFTDVALAVIGAFVAYLFAVMFLCL